jgi:imidazolonepropionase-like amidohydrolase
MPAAPLTLLPATRGRRIWLQVGTLLDGTGAPPQRDAHVVYDAGSILFVGNDGAGVPRALLTPGQTVPDAVLPHATLLPGLIEAHAHLFLEGGELDAAKRSACLLQTPDALLDHAVRRLEKLLHFGVTAVRDAGDKDGVGLALSRLYRRPNRPVMPYLDSPGAAIHHRGRYGGFMADALENYPTPAACVEARVRAGADRIKLIPTGIINFKQGAVTSEPQMTTDEVRSIVTAARAHQRQTFAHASGDIGIERAIEGGVDSIEHGFFIRDDQLAQLRDRQIAWVPTFAPVQRQIDHAARMGWDATVVDHLRRILERHAHSLVKAHALGVTILAGSDAGSYAVPHGDGFLYELELMERSGLPSSAVLHAATGASAGRLAFPEPFGRIAAGCPSRFIVADFSPLATVSNLRRRRTIVFDQQVFVSDENLESHGL